ncbi:hypothetical protein [Saccharomonospora saliphila]|uniref:hypothetical protein n=1 Tax=Saccharomonospora saliphila TaxID=369829 RepID=UPI000371AD0A|nr:hypothetical protein [Saccharomonospora saliphila]
MTTAVVWEGDADSPTVLVLDPTDPPAAGAELPPGWDPLARRRQVVWCRLAAPDALAEASRLLGDPDALGRPIDVVLPGGAEKDPASRLLRRHAGAVRSVVLIDAAPEPTGADGVAGGAVPVHHAGDVSLRGRSPDGEDVCADVQRALDELDRTEVRPPHTDQPRPRPGDS